MKTRLFTLFAALLVSASLAVAQTAPPPPVPGGGEGADAPPPPPPAREDGPGGPGGGGPGPRQGGPGGGPGMRGQRPGGPGGGVPAPMSPGGAGPGMGAGGGPGGPGGPGADARLRHLEMMRNYFEVVDRYARLARDPAHAGIAAVVSAADILRPRGTDAAIEYFTKALGDAKSASVQRAIRIQLVDLYKAAGKQDEALNQLRELMMSATDSAPAASGGQ